MPTLYIENFPEDLYDAIRKRARDERRSIAAEVIEILEKFVPTEKELARRREFVENLARLRETMRPLSGDGPTSTEMIREDRDSR